MPSSKPPVPGPARIVAVALSPLLFVGGGVGVALVGVGLTYATGFGVGAALAGLMAWLDLRSGA